MFLGQHHNQKCQGDLLFLLHANPELNYSGRQGLKTQLFLAERRHGSMPDAIFDTRAVADFARTPKQKHTCQGYLNFK